MLRAGALLRADVQRGDCRAAIRLRCWSARPPTSPRSLPSSPGYAGTFDAALTRVAQDALNISTGLAGAYDIVVHATLFLPVVVVGTLVLWRSHITFNQVTHTPAPVADTAVLAPQHHQGVG